MHIRKFREEDARKAYNILKRNLLEINSSQYEEKTINALLADSTPKRLIEKSKERTYYVVVKKDKLLGFGGYSDDQVHTFFVNPDVHGKGIGKIIMKKVLQDMKRKGIKEANCASTKYAEKFYQSFGFKTLNKKTVDY